ncbi:hypothetical protein NIES2104_00910 [Leptolyngbya sp. NIES-2104]|nr:hypothetical protein NIES2104_00910 [Leptolyngbya sp. NIES-2104]
MKSRSLSSYRSLSLTTNRAFQITNFQHFTEISGQICFNLSSQANFEGEVKFVPP